MKNKLNVVKLVKDNARREIGAIPTTKFIPNKNKRVARHPKREMEFNYE